MVDLSSEPSKARLGQRQALNTSPPGTASRPPLSRYLFQTEYTYGNDPNPPKG